MHTFARDEEQRIAFVRLNKQLGLGGLQVLQIASSNRVHATITSVPSLTRELSRSGRTDADPAGRMRTRLTPCVKASLQAFSFGNIPPETTACSSSAGICLSESQRMTLPSAPLTPGTSVRKTRASAFVAIAQADAISSALML